MAAWEIPAAPHRAPALRHADATAVPDLRVSMFKAFDPISLTHVLLPLPHLRHRLLRRQLPPEDTGDLAEEARRCADENKNRDTDQGDSCKNLDRDY
jgi:hypothetical protein